MLYGENKYLATDEDMERRVSKATSHDEHQNNVRQFLVPRLQVAAV